MTKFIRWLLLAAAIVAGTVWVVHFIHRMLAYEETDDAYVNGRVHQVSARVAGTVNEVLVRENQTVREGEVLARLDPLELKIALQKAKAALAQMQARAAQARAAQEEAEAGRALSVAQTAQAEAQVQEATAQLEVANVNSGRNQRLFEGDVRAVSKSEVDTTKSGAAAARASLAAAQANLQATKARAQSQDAAIKAAEADAAAAEAGVDAQAAAVQDAERELSYVEIRAPAAGRIGNKNVERGNRVQSGQALFALVEPEVWVTANFKETQLSAVRAGQPVELLIDALRGDQFSGRVESIAPASGAQFALLPADNATGNFTKVVQRVPVKITFDPESLHRAQDRLRPGLSTVVSVRIK